jgi:hypothetical protein
MCIGEYFVRLYLLIFLLSKVADHFSNNLYTILIFASLYLKFKFKTLITL